MCKTYVILKSVHTKAFILLGPCCVEVRVRIIIILLISRVLYDATELKRKAFIMKSFF
jgi:hypothetical protein